jgi:hypothetical protein
MKSQESQDSRKGIKLFFYFLLDDRKIWIRTPDEWIRIQEAQKHTDPTVSDPQHWYSNL